MQRPGVVGDDDRAPAEEPGEPPKGAAPAEIGGPAAHGSDHRGDQGTVLLDPDDGHAGAGPGQSVPHGRELLRRPPAALVARRRVDHGERRPVFRERLPGLVEVPRRHRESRGSKVTARAPTSAATSRCLMYSDWART